MEDQEQQDVLEESTGEDEEKPSKQKLQVQQRAKGQNRETKGTCLPAGLNGWQKTETSWIPPVAGQRPGESRNT